MLFTAELAARAASWDLLTSLIVPGFLDRWMRVGPAPATAVLLLDHAAATLHGDAVDVEGTRGSFRLLCELSPPGDREPLCAKLRALREVASPDAKRRVARAAVESLVASAPSKGR